MKNRLFIPTQKATEEWSKLVHKRLDAYFSGDENKHKLAIQEEELMRDQMLKEWNNYFLLRNFL